MGSRSGSGCRGDDGDRMVGPAGVSGRRSAFEAHAIACPLEAPVSGGLTPQAPRGRRCAHARARFAHLGVVEAEHVCEVVAGVLEPRQHAAPDARQHGGRSSVGVRLLGGASSARGGALRRLCARGRGAGARSLALPFAARDALGELDLFDVAAHHRRAARLRPVPPPLHSRRPTASRAPLGARALPPRPPAAARTCGAPRALPSPWSTRPTPRAHGPARPSHRSIPPPPHTPTPPPPLRSPSLPRPAPAPGSAAAASDFPLLLSVSLSHCVRMRTLWRPTARGTRTARRRAITLRASRHRSARAFGPAELRAATPRRDPDADADPMRADARAETGGLLALDAPNNHHTRTTHTQPTTTCSLPTHGVTHIKAHTSALVSRG